jgi:hypothetical protein
MGAEKLVVGIEIRAIEPIKIKNFLTFISSSM